MIQLKNMFMHLEHFTGRDPQMLLPGGGGGGALKAEVLNRAAKAARGYDRGDEPPLIRGSGGLPRKIFQNLCF